MGYLNGERYKIVYKRKGCSCKLVKWVTRIYKGFFRGFPCKRHKLVGGTK